MDMPAIAPDCNLKWTNMFADRWLDAVFPATNLPISARLASVYIKMAANDGLATIPTAALANALGLHQITVLTAVRHLEGRGFLEAHLRRGCAGVYRLTLNGEAL